MGVLRSGMRPVSLRFVGEAGDPVAGVEVAVGVAAGVRVALGVAFCEVVAVAAAVVGGGGGGRDTIAQAGGKDPEKLEEALALAAKTVEAALGA